MDNYESYRIGIFSGYVLMVTSRNSTSMQTSLHVPLGVCCLYPISFTLKSNNGIK
jgi:hypothetical protein